MSGTMNRADLQASLKESLHDSGEVLAPEDFERCLDTALLEFSRRLPRLRNGSLQLIYGETSYPAPADLIGFHIAEWQWDRSIPVWEGGSPGTLPRVSACDGHIQFSFALSPRQISLLGGKLPYRYKASHQIGAAAEDTTVPAHQRDLLLLRAQAECLRELAMRNITKPVSMRDGGMSSPKNGTPAALYERLLAEFHDRVGA